VTAKSMVTILPWIARRLSVYAALENEAIPEFYERNEKGLPLKWLGRVRESMARLTSQFSATRAIREYTEKYYLPAASSYSERAAGIAR